MFDNLTEKLEGAFKNLKGDGKLTELNIAQSVKEIRLTSDLTKPFTENEYKSFTLDEICTITTKLR